VAERKAQRTMREIKEQFRLDRHREFLRTALDIVNRDGLAALTMPGLAEALDCGIGTLYQHFRSKDALIAELQREALDVVGTSFRLAQARTNDLLEERGVVDPAVVGLTRSLAAARFWIAADTVFPQEIDLSRRMLVDPPSKMDQEAASRVVPAAHRLLDFARRLLEDASAAGAIDDGPALERAFIVIAGSSGVLMTSTLDGGTGEFDGPAIASMMIDDLFRAWGAAPEVLDRAAAVVAELEAQGHLVTPVRR
jgi:AcrR family transcriptional regulator